jgi:hypothetical protein
MLDCTVNLKITTGLHYFTFHECDNGNLLKNIVFTLVMVFYIVICGLVCVLLTVVRIVMNLFLVAYVYYYFASLNFLFYLS